MLRKREKSEEKRIGNFKITPEKGIEFNIGNHQIELENCGSWEALLQEVLRCFPFSNDMVNLVDFPEGFIVPSAKLQNAIFTLPTDKKPVVKCLNDLKDACKILWALQQELPQGIKKIVSKLEKLEPELYGFQQGFLIQTRVPGIFEAYQNLITKALSYSFDSSMEENGILFQALSKVQDYNKKQTIFNEQAKLLYDRGEAYLSAIEEGGVVQSDELKYTICTFDQRNIDLSLKIIEAVLSDKESRTYLEDHVINKYFNKYVNYFNNLIQLGVQPKYTKDGLEHELENHFANNINLYLEMEMCKMKIAFMELKLASLAEQKKLPKESKEEANSLEEEFINCQKNLVALKKQEESTLIKVEAKLNVLSQDYLKFSQSDLLEKLYSKLDLSRSSHSTQIQEFIRKTWLEQLSDYYQYIPSFSTLGRIAKNTAAGGIMGAMVGGVSPITPITMSVGVLTGFTVGTLGGVSELAYNTMASSISYAKSTVVHTIYGKYHGTYDSPEYQPNKEMIALFNGDEVNAAVVNAFYVNQLFELDVILSNLSESEKKEKDNQVLNSVFNNLKEHYQKIRKGEYSSKEAKEIWKKDLSVQLMLLDARLSQSQVSINCYAFAETKETKLSQEKMSLAGSQTLAIGDTQELPILPLEESENVESKAIISAKSLALEKEKYSIEEENERAVQDALIETQNKELNREATVAKVIEKEVTSELKKFEQLLDLATNFILPGNSLKKLDPSTQNKLHLKENTEVSLNQNLLFYLKKSLKNNNPSFIILYYYELCASYSLTSSQSLNLKKEMNTPLVEYGGKSFWHLMVEWDKGAEFLKELIRYSKKQEFGYFFDPNCTYLGMNALEKAISEKNYEMARLFMKQITSSPSTIKDDPQGLKKCFEKALKDPELVSLMEDIYKVRKDTSFSNKGYLQMSAAKLRSNESSAEVQKRYEILGALWLYKDQHLCLPTSETELLKFLENISAANPTQPYLTVECFQPNYFKREFLPEVVKSVMKKYQQSNKKENLEMEDFVNIEKEEEKFTDSPPKSLLSDYKRKTKKEDQDKSRKSSSPPPKERP